MANQCIECGEPAPHRLICAACLPSYGEMLSDDICRCDTCKTDCAGIIPCEREEKEG